LLIFPIAGLEARIPPTEKFYADHVFAQCPLCTDVPNYHYLFKTGLIPFLLLPTRGIGAGHRPEYDNIEFISEVAADTRESPFGIGKRDQGSVGGGFLRLEHCKPDLRPALGIPFFVI
jgi:hypothetical protein